MMSFIIAERLPVTLTGCMQGRQYPVDVMYAPQPVDSYLDAVLKTVLQIHLDEAEGDILAFLTGQDEIETLQRLINDRCTIS